METLNLKTLSDAEYTAISDYEIIGGWKVDKDGATFEFNMHDLKVNDKSDILCPTSFNYEQSSYSDDSTGHNTVDDSTFEWTEYDVFMTKEQVQEIVKETIREDATFLAGLLEKGEELNRIFLKDFINDVKNFTK